MRKQWLIFLQLAFETRGTASWHDSITLCEKRRLARDNNVWDTFEGKRVKVQRGGKQISPSVSYRHTQRNITDINSTEQEEGKLSPRVQQPVMELALFHCSGPKASVLSNCDITQEENKQYSSLNSALKSDDMGASKTWWFIKNQQCQASAYAQGSCKGLYQAANRLMVKTTR